MAIDMKTKAIKMALGMLPKSLIDSVPEMIVGAIRERMDAAAMFPGEKSVIMIDQIDGELYIKLDVTDGDGCHVRTDQFMKAKDFIKHLISMTDGNKQ